MNPAKVQPLAEARADPAGVQGPPATSTIEANRRAVQVHLPPSQKSPVVVWDEGDGEEKLPGGESSTSHPTTAAVHVAAPAAASTTLPEAGDTAFVAATSAASTGISTATDAADAAAADSDECIGADTHVVGFEGARDQIIVVAKKMTVMRWLLGEEKRAEVNHVIKTFMLTPIFFVSGMLTARASWSRWYTESKTRGGTGSLLQAGFGYGWRVRPIVL